MIDRAGDRDMSSIWSRQLAHQVPKVVLHDHLDGGLRPETLLELAQERGHVLPSDDPGELAMRMTAGAARRNLELYLEGFVHTVAVLQDVEAIERVAREAVDDLAADGVVYAELRFAPELNTRTGLAMDDVVEAALAGMAQGPIPSGLIVDGMRTSSPETVLAAAEVALRWRDRGVVGFDLAGAEAWNPASHHADALALVVREDLPLTLHAGEAAGVQMVAEAIYRFGATRIGHGVTLIEDVSETGALGPVAACVVDLGIVLEMCPTSNVHTGAVASLPTHPIDRLAELGVVVTINTDNRLMSGVTMTSEVLAVAETFEWSTARVVDSARAAADAAFCEPSVRADVMAEIDRRAANLVTGQPDG